MRGQILGVNRDKMEILVKHEEIPGLMPAMTMPWKVQTANMLDNIGPGDLITSEIVVDNNQGVVTKITKLGAAKPDVPAPAGPYKLRREISGARRPRPESGVRRSGWPRARFQQHSRRSRHGDYLHLHEVPDSDILSRPWIASSPKRRRSSRKRGSPEKAGLLSVSFDPKNDTPAVLTQHARKLGADSKVWTFATGDREEIDRFASSLLLTLVRGEAANPDEIGHTLRTTVVDRNGKIAKSYSGADWTPAELVAELERLL